jgi:RNA polymerase sigma factor (sigma-70 family)
MSAAALMPTLRRIVGVNGAGSSDRHLLEQYLQGDHQAFATLVDRHGPMVHGVCRRVLGNCHDAEDAAQAAFLVLLRQSHKIVHLESLGSWLHGVAYRVALKAQAAARRRKRVERQAAPADFAESHADAVWRELRPILDEEIARLPEKYRLPLVLCYLEGKTNAQAARQLQWPMGTVATRMAQARQRLRKRLTQRGASLAAATLFALETPKATSAACRSLPIGQGSKRALALAKGVSRAMTLSKRSINFVAIVTITVLAIGAVLFLFSFVDAEGPKSAAGKESRRFQRGGEATVLVPAATPSRREFLVECKLAEVDKDGEEAVLSRPNLQMIEGQSARCLVGQDFPVEGLSRLATVTAGVELEATVTRSNDGRFILDVSMHFKIIPEVKNGLAAQHTMGANYTAVINLGQTTECEFEKDRAEQTKYRAVFTVSEVVRKGNR